MSKSILAIREALWPPDISRRGVFFDDLAVQLAVIAAKYYVDNLPEVEDPNTHVDPPIPEDLTRGIKAFVANASRSGQGGKVRNGVYLKEALEGYARAYHKKPHDLSAELEEVARQEALYLADSFDNFLATAYVMPAFHNIVNISKTNNSQGRKEQVVNLLSTFLLYLFYVVLQNPDLQDQIKLRSPENKPRPRQQTVHASSVLNSIKEGMTIAQIREAMNALVLPEDVEEKGDIKVVRQITTAEGISATVCSDNVARVGVRYPSLEFAMTTAFERVVGRYEQLEYAIVVASRRQLREVVVEETSVAYDEILEQVADRKTRAVEKRIKEEFLPHMAAKLARVKKIAALAQEAKEIMKGVIAAGGLETLTQADKHLRDGALMNGIADQTTGLMQLLSTPYNEERAQAIRAMQATLSIYTGVLELQKKMTMIIAHLKKLLPLPASDQNKPEPTRVMTDEQDAFRNFITLQKVLATGPNGAENVQRDTFTAELGRLLDRVIADAEIFDEAVAGVINNWKSWQREMFFVSADNPSAWTGLAGKYAEPKENHPERRLAQGRVYGLAPHHRRLDLNGIDDEAWQKFAGYVMVGLWKGNPFYAGEWVQTASAIDQLRETFPIYDRQADFPDTHGAAVMADPIGFFGERETGNVPESAVYVYENMPDGQDLPIGVLRRILNKITFVEEAKAQRRVTQYE